MIAAGKKYDAHTSYVLMKFFRRTVTQVSVLTYIQYYRKPMMRLIAALKAQ